MLDSIYRSSVLKLESHYFLIVRLDGQEIPMSSHFKYLGFIIQKDGEINSCMNLRLSYAYKEIKIT